jgi:predicted RNase H-like nuclease
MPELLGLDGCKNGAWVAAWPGPRFEVTHDLSRLMRLAGQRKVCMVLDVPIGLIGAGRRCDAEARALLKRRHSSVFTPPSRAALAGATREDASRLNHAACGMKVGCQAFGILPRIAAVDSLMHPDLQECVRESHPEVSFAIISGSPMRYAKRHQEGKKERLAVLARLGLQFDMDAVRGQLGRSLVAGDDVIDAAIMLATAMRIMEKTARRLPAELQERDERGLLAEMWA